MSKLNELLTNWPRGLVYTTSYLKDQGYSASLLAKYKKHNWIETIGKGAVVKKGDPLDWRGAVTALQKQLKLEVHVGARTALRMHGVSHFLLEAETVFLFGVSHFRLPTWFKNKKWGPFVEYFPTKLFKTDIGLLRHKTDEFSLLMSSRERALFEQLYLVPKYSAFADSSYLFEGLYTLRHDLIQKLLVECESIKVKRLFMVLAEEHNFPWAKKLDLTGIDFGRGNRTLEPGGSTNSKYKITIKPAF